MKTRRQLKQNLIIQKKTLIEKIDPANTKKKFIKIKIVDLFIWIKLSIVSKINIWMKRFKKQVSKRRKIVSTKQTAKTTSQKCLQYYYQRKTLLIQKRIILDIWTRRQSIIFVMMSVYSSLISSTQEWKLKLSQTIY